VVNFVGVHATRHAQPDFPLQSDIDTILQSVSTGVETSRSAEELASHAVEASGWPPAGPDQVATLTACRRLLAGRRQTRSQCALRLHRGLMAAARIAAATGTKRFAERSAA
jgi:hypothetical protein